MRLALDAGNTQVKWAWNRGRAHAIAYQARDLRALLCAAWSGEERPEAVHVASVAAETVNRDIVQAVRDCWPGIEPIFLVSRAECCGVRVAYAQPERFGVDRFAALVAARAEAQDRPLVVVDAGTAITVDVLDATGQHLGGVIMPGLRLLKASLLRGTARVAGHLMPRLDAETCNEPALSSDTAGAVEAGALLMCQGGVRRALEVASRQVGTGARIYLTGGDAPMLRPILNQEYHWRPDLVLEGVARMGVDGFAPGAGDGIESSPLPA